MAKASVGGKWFRLRRWPTWRSWLLILSGLALLIVWLGPKVHNWLALTERTPNAAYIVVEGWCPDHVLDAARRELESSQAKLLFTTGIPLEKGHALAEYKDYATLSAATLTAAGMDPTKIRPAPCLQVTRDRTAAMAAALKAVLDAQNIPEAERSLNLFTQGTHARRSRLIFQRILGPTWKVGVISIPSQAYKEQGWWKQSAGAKSVIDELVALGVTVAGGE